MFDAIFNNIFILIPVAIFIGLRILEARKKRQESSPEKKPNPFVEETREPSGPSSHWETDEKNQAYGTAHGGISPLGVPIVVVKPPAEVYHHPPQQLSLEAERPLAQPVKPQKTSAPEHPVSGVFPRKVERLPALKKALVLSEILGPPKGLRDYP